MKKLLYKFQKFMVGRYGRNDFVGLTALILGLMISMIGSAVIKHDFFVGISLRIIYLLLIGYCLWRPFSKNVYKRNRENMAVAGVYKRIKSFFLLNFRRVRFFKGSVFRVCPHCKAQIRLPRRRGKHTVKCPCCREKFGVRVIFGKK